MIQWIKRQIAIQLAAPTGVRPVHKWSVKDYAFYIDSQIGLIKFKPKTTGDLVKFRDRFINEMEMIVKRWEIGDDVTKDLRRIYCEIMSTYSVKYKATVAMRLKRLGL